MTTKRKIIFLVLALAVLSLNMSPTLAECANSHDSIIRMHQTTNDAGMIEDIPYVWQEINGFCYWGALTMAIKHAGIDIDMHDLFAVSVTGFSALYANSGSDMSFWPGVFLRQIWIGTSTSELLGLDADFYFDTYTEMGAEAARVLQGRGDSIPQG